MTDPQMPDLDPRLRERLADLPESVEPARDLWPDIRAQLDADRVRSLDGARSAAPVRRVPAWVSRAAAVAVIVAGTAVVTWQIKGDTPPEVIIVETVPAARVSNGLESYERSADELALTLANRRAKLDPATVEVLERSLATIDSAITEARAALARDPASAEIRAYVEAAYRQKIDFLRRANDVAAIWEL